MDVEDLRQSALVRMLAGFRRWDGRRRGWLWAAAAWGAQREARVASRRGAKWGRGIETLGDRELLSGATLLETMVAAPTESPLEQAAERDLVAWVRSGIARLSEHDQVLLELRFMNGLLVREIALLIGAREQCTYMRVRAALRRPRRELKELPRAG